MAVINLKVWFYWQNYFRMCSRLSKTSSNIKMFTKFSVQLFSSGWLAAIEPKQFAVSLKLVERVEKTTNLRYQFSVSSELINRIQTGSSNLQGTSDSNQKSQIKMSVLTPNQIISPLTTVSPTNKTQNLPWLYDIEYEDTNWIITSSFMIFTMQTGFGMLESGCVSVKNEVNIMMKNVADIVLGGKYNLLIFFFFFWIENFLLVRPILYQLWAHLLSGSVVFWDSRATSCRVWIFTTHNGLGQAASVDSWKYP